MHTKTNGHAKRFLDKPGRPTADRKPLDLEAEKLLLTAMIRQNELIPEIAAEVSPLDFRDRTYQLLYFVILDLDRDGHGADVTAVAKRLAEVIDRKRTLRDYPWDSLALDTIPCGLLGELATGFVTGNLPYHIRTVRGAGIYQRLVLAAEEIMIAAMERRGSPEEVLSLAERKIGDITNGRSARAVKHVSKHVAESLLSYDDKLHRRNQAEVRYGLQDIDNLTGGLHPGELILIAARTSVGKTALAVNLARNVAVDQGKTVYVASLEQSGLELANRLLCTQGNLCSQKMRFATFGPDECRIFSDAADTVGGSKIFIDESANQDIYHILTNCRQAKRKDGLALVIVDYIQLVDAENRGNMRHEQVGEVSRKLKQMAKELAVPVVALAQVNRRADDRADGKPKLSDLRESGSLEQDSDTVIFLYKSQTKAESDGELISLLYADVAKQRNGPVGEVTLAYRKDCFKIENYAPVDGGWRP